MVINLCDLEGLRVIVIEMGSYQLFLRTLPSTKSMSFQYVNMRNGSSRPTNEVSCLCLYNGCELVKLIVPSIGIDGLSYFNLPPACY